MVQLEIRGDSKTVVEWINNKARQGKAKVGGRCRGDGPKPTVGMVGRGVNLRRKVDHWAVRTFREHNKAADAGAEKREARGLADELENESGVVWSDAT